LRIVITGGSGFIGHNLLVYLISKGHQVLNVDKHAPPDDAYKANWYKADVLDVHQFCDAVVKFAPDFMVHLAAKTDLSGKDLAYYDVNIHGVKNVIHVCLQCPELKRVIFASSMLVCKSGYIPENEDDYAPDTIYGESKVHTEKIIKRIGDAHFKWVIVRPTSIWGPWFKTPYRNFFDILLSNRYFRIGKKSSTKTFGYIGNCVKQIESLLFAHEACCYKIYYLGDLPLNIDYWASEIARLAHIRKPIRLPFFLFKILAWLGDVLSVIGVYFPINSFRLKNMTTNNILDTNPIRSITPPPEIGLEVSIKETLVWIKKNQQ